MTTATDTLTRVQGDQATRTPAPAAVLQASKDRRLARLGVVVTKRPGMAVYDYPVPS